MSFKRSPSKVWYGSDSVQFREISASPGSQDSGFSDTETSPHLQGDAKPRQDATPCKTEPKIPKDIFKRFDTVQTNLSCNYKEKSTPNKSKLTTERLTKSECKTRTPERVQNRAESAKKLKHTKNSSKVFRSLFPDTNPAAGLRIGVSPNQYSKETSKNDKPVDGGLLDSLRRDNTRYSNEINTNADGNEGYLVVQHHHQTAPAILERSVEEEEEDASFEASDCDSELECLFGNGLASPKHTSTPKAECFGEMRHRKQKVPLEVFLRRRHQRVPPIHTDALTVDNNAVQKWLVDARLSYEQECTTTLQCKSIVGELNQKVSHMASCCTTIIRGVLSQARTIQTEYETLNTANDYVEPLVQNLAGNILDFLKTHCRVVSSKILKLHDAIREGNDTKQLGELYATWEKTREEIVNREAKKLVEKLEDPTSELDLRATVTGITSVALHNADLIEIFVKSDAIPILLILCERCEGSSMKSLILRAISTMCGHSLAVRQFEKFSGLQLITDIIEEDSRPEPERCEAVAVLAQITAPWLEDNYTVNGLQDYSRRLVRCLTKLSSSTRCCQNLLLCSAALANLSSMDSKSVRHMVHSKTAKVLLESLRNRGPLVSVFLLEQVATLLANMSASETARKQLARFEAAKALLCFLRTTCVGDDVERRLQQKSVIALSRLCGEKEVSEQVVRLGGVEKLVKLCREKEERFDSDAVLVAALATLRKIADACGTHVLSAEDAQELVEPKLLDSFLAYSAQNESYV